jgi:aarF domain-containing kinase
MERIGRTLSTDPMTGSPVTPVVVTPRPVGGLVTKRVLVMDFLQGVPLSRAVEAMEKRGIDPGSPEAQLFGRRLLAALTEAFGITILFGGFFHADPHPGNIFVLDDGRIGLIDFGQVKQIGQRASATLAKVMVALSERTSDTDPAQLDEISRLALELGVRLREGAPREGPAATAIWLFDGSVKTLPGGFDTNELSPDSPVKVLKSSMMSDPEFAARFYGEARMMAALQKAGRPFETMVYPGQTHAIRDPALQLHLWQTVMAFLERNLN